MSEITWLSDHDESLNGGIVRMRVGKPSDIFLTEYDKDPESYQQKGYTVFGTTSGRFVKQTLQILVNPPTKGLPVPKPPSFLRDFQKGHFLSLWDCYTRGTSAGDFSDTGTGKTYVTIALALAMNRPLFVVCLLAGMDKWKRLIRDFGVKSICVGNYEFFKGDNEFGRMQTFFYPAKIFNAVTMKENGQGVSVPAFCPFPKTKRFKTFELALEYLFARTYVRPQALTAFENKTGKSLRMLSREITGYEWRLPPETFIVFDEAHKCKGEDTQNSRLLIAAKPYVTEIVTATPGVTPRDFRATGYSLGLHSLYDFDLWTEVHGCRRVYTQGKTRKFIGWDYAKGSGGLDSLSKELYPAHASRMRISEIPGFPKTVITAESFDAKEAPEVNKLYAEFVSDCKDKVAQKKMIPVTSVLRFRMLVEKLKVPLYASLIEEAHENGFSVAMFVNFTDTLNLLKKRFLDAPVIHGGQKKADREAGRLRFENNEVKTILVNIQAGGASLDLHDIHGGFPRMALISPTYNPYDLKQTFGRVRRDAAKSTSFQRIIYMAGTQEEKVCEKVRLKLKAFDEVNAEVTESDLIEDVLLRTLSPQEREKIAQAMEAENDGDAS